MPTFIIFKQGTLVDKIQGADGKKLQAAVKKLAAEAEGGSSGFGGASGSGSNWRTGDLPRGYNNVTDQVDVKGLELLNADSGFGSVRVLVDDSKPSGLKKGKAVAEKKDWVESDTDEQLMLFMPFQSTLKVHTLQVHPGLHIATYVANYYTDYFPPSYSRRRRRSSHATKDNPDLHQSRAHPGFRRGR